MIICQSRCVYLRRWMNMSCSAFDQSNIHSTTFCRSESILSWVFIHSFDAYIYTYIYIYICHNFERHSVLRMRACNDSFFVKDVSNEQIFFSLVCWSIVGQDRKYKGISSFLFQFHRMIIISNELHHWVMHAHTHWVTPIESRTQTRKHPENQQDEIAIIN